MFKLFFVQWHKGLQMTFWFQCVCVQVHLLVQLALADLLAALILMSTSVMNKVGIHSNVLICQYSLPLSLVRNSHFHSARTKLLPQEINRSFYRVVSGSLRELQRRREFSWIKILQGFSGTSHEWLSSVTSSQKNIPYIASIKSS